MNGDFGPFTIDVEFAADFPPERLAQYRAAFDQAKQRWLNVIAEGLSPVQVDGNMTSGLRIVAALREIDGEAGLGARTDINQLRRDNAKPGADLPAKATITLDTRDLALLEANPPQGVNLDQIRCDLIAHEIGHALGFTKDVWLKKGLLELNAEGVPIPRFRGDHASKKYAELRELREPTNPPLEDFGLGREFISHWKQAIFRSELMTATLEYQPNKIGPVTVAALGDLGYVVKVGDELIAVLVEQGEEQKIDLPEEQAAGAAAQPALPPRIALAVPFANRPLCLNCRVTVAGA